MTARNDGSYTPSVSEFQSAMSVQDTVHWLEDRLRQIDLPADDRRALFRCLYALRAIIWAGDYALSLFEEEFELPEIIAVAGQGEN